jgi:two-component system chemotaxis response regulator CheB
LLAGKDGAARRVVAIGVSTGGPRTLLDVVPYLPVDLDAAVVVVQHMPESFTGQFAQRLNDACAIPFKEAEAGDLLLSGHGYLARGGKHMVFAKRVLNGGAIVRYTTQPEDALHIPSVNVMMDSAVHVFGSEVIGVLLTGMGDDGADGMVRIRQAGGRTIAEDESTCIVFGMPAQAIERGGAECVLPCHEIAERIVSWVGHTPSLARVTS